MTHSDLSCLCGGTLPADGVSGLLRAIADHVEAGDGFSNGQWHRTAPVVGLGEAWWRRKAFIIGVTISREVVADQLRQVADWTWQADD